MSNKSFSLIFYRVKNKEKFLGALFSIKNSFKILLESTEKYKVLKKERLELMKIINKNNKDILSYLSELQKHFPSLEGLEDFKKEVRIDRKQEKNLFHDLKEKEELNLELIKEELKKIEEDLLKLSLD